MKLTLLFSASLLFGATLGLAYGQDRPGGPDGEKRPPASGAAARLSTRYEAIAAFDADKSGKLDTSELAAVAKAIDGGSLEVGPPRHGTGKGEGKPEAGRPPGDKVASYAGKMYESLVAYDTDESGKLDASEQAVLTKAIEDGSLKLPRPGGRPGDRRGPRPEKE